MGDDREAGLPVLTESKGCKEKETTEVRRQVQAGQCLVQHLLNEKVSELMNAFNRYQLQS